MGSRLRCTVGTIGIMLAALAVPAGALANNPAGAPAEPIGQVLGPAASTEGGFGPSASFVAGLGLVDDVFLKGLGVTPPGNPYSGPELPPICGAGCGGGI